MKSFLRLLTLVLTATVLTLQAAPTVFPTGTTIYKPEQAWNGYTVLSVLDTRAVLVIDMNGNVVKRWEDFNVSSGGPARILPGGDVIAATGAFPGHQEGTALVQRDFDGNEVWRWDRSEEIELADGTRMMSSRQHHDWQRSDFPAGYYSPDFTPSLTGANTLLLTHTSYRNPNIIAGVLEDDRLIEVSPAGEIRWDWRIGDHIDEFRFKPEAREAIRRNAGEGRYDWAHINSATYVGPNRWYDAGDERFHPDNVIISSRNANFISIINRTGNVAWQIGPDFDNSPEELAIGQIIGQHHAHFVPPGLPGAGNVIIFDNGGSSGYGAPSPLAPTGLGIYKRSLSRVLEIDPVTLEVVWSYTNPNFFSTNISAAQRLPNGNTLITEGAPGRVFEVTPEREIVWEYMNPPGESSRGSNAVYRAYRLPYGWIPQLPAPRETPVTPPEPGTFILPADA